MKKKIHLGVPRYITLDCDMKFISHFLCTIWKLLPQSWIDVRTSFLNKSLGNLLRSLVKEHLRKWDFSFIELSLLIIAQSIDQWNKTSIWRCLSEIHIISGSLIFVNSSKSEYGSWRVWSTKNKGSIWTSSRTIEAILKFTSPKLKVDAQRRSLGFKEGGLIMVYLYKEYL